MKKIILIFIIALAFILRFYRLGDYPALNADEAAIGYNAYSLMETGKDEHGNPWPIHFQSFNDYKPGAYFYMVLPFIKFMGLNEWAVRIPGAFLGVLAVLVVYFLVKELFKDEKTSLIAGFMLAISPWHIHFSRGGWEVNVATFFITFGILVFLKALKNPKLFTFSFLLFTLSLYSYHAARIVVPLLGLGLTLIYLKDIKENLKGFVIAGVIGMVLLLPLAKDLFGPAGVSRAAGVGLFADEGPFNRINEQRGEHTNFASIVPKVLHNKPVNYGLAFVQNWAEHYHGEFLFLSGDDIQRNKVPETGQTYLLDAVWLVIGGWWLVKNTKNKSVQLILYWLLIAPVAAALTFQSPHSLRAHNMVIPLVITGSIGFNFLFTGFRGRLKILKWILIFVISLSFGRYLHMYYVHMAKEYPFSSQYGVKELASYIKDNGDKYQKVWVTDRYDQPYILLLFYLKHSPVEFQKGHELTPRARFGFSTVRDFDKFHFEGVNFDKIRPENPNALIVGTDEEIHDEANIVKEIYGANGYKYFQVVAN